MDADFSAIIAAERKIFHRNLATSGLLVFNQKTKKDRKTKDSKIIKVPSVADADNADSIRIAESLLSRLGITEEAKPLAAQKIGTLFEGSCAEFLSKTFPKLDHLRPGKWQILSLGARDSLGLAAYEQYSHLAAIRKACERDSQLAALLGQDYLIAPDLVVVRDLEPDEVINRTNLKLVDETVAKHADLRLSNGGKPLLHASISCKMTMRSDRAQNSRSEALNLIRTRKGRAPHVIVVTGEPLPSRLSSLALGTGDIDCVYHVALPELVAAVDAEASDDSKESIAIMVSGKRLKDIADLVLDLAI